MIDPEQPGAAREDLAADEPPPILSRWSYLYAVVIGVLIAIILALSWLTRRYS